MFERNVWFTKYKQNNNATIRLFCFHYAGGSASTFRGWVEDLDDFVELIAIQLPGRENRYGEMLINNINQIIDNLSLHFNQYLNKPFVFLGHSLGALIAFELVRSLRRKGKPQPKQLIVSATRAPQVKFNKHIIHKLDDANFSKELMKYNGMPRVIIENKELFSLLMPIVRADFCVSETYQYLHERPLSCPITAFGGLNDNTFSQEDLVRWKDQTVSSFNDHYFQGDHFFIKSSYNEVINIVNKILREEIV